MRSTFKILFYLKKNSPKPDGTVPVMGRITIDGTISQFSCKMNIPPDLWDTKAGRLTGKSALAIKNNLALDKIRVDINRHYQEVMQAEALRHLPTARLTQRRAESQWQCADKYRPRVGRTGNGY
jgi:hypothetical protein